MTQAAAKTGSGPTAMVAIEQHFPKDQRIIDDNLAYRILPRGMRAHDPKRREMFGFPRLRRLVAEHDADAAEEERSLVELLMDELRSFTGEGWEQEDDITLLTLKRSASLS